MITYQFMKIRQHNTFIFSCNLICLIVSFDFRNLPFDFSGIKLFEACSASFKTSSGKTQSFKHILRNCYFYKQPNVTITPEHIMQTRFPTRNFFLCLTGLKMIIGVDFYWCQAAKVTIYSEDEIGVKRRR
jgi:hypothetical protein